MTTVSGGGRMSIAFEVTSDDVSIVLGRLDPEVRSMLPQDPQEILDDIVEEGAVESAALHGDSMDEQTGYALDEIQAQLLMHVKGRQVALDEPHRPSTPLGAHKREPHSMVRKEKSLVKFLASACVYAQDHISSFEGSKAEKEFSMEATSHTVACFIAQNTVDGSQGVETNIVLRKLVKKKKELPYWEKVIKKLVKEYGGFK